MVCIYTYPCGMYPERIYPECMYIYYICTYVCMLNSELKQRISSVEGAQGMYIYVCFYSIYTYMYICSPQSQCRESPQSREQFELLLSEGNLVRKTVGPLVRELLHTHTQYMHTTHAQETHAHDAAACISAHVRLLIAHFEVHVYVWLFYIYVKHGEEHRNLCRALLHICRLKSPTYTCKRALHVRHGEEHRNQPCNKTPCVTPPCLVCVHCVGGCVCVRACVCVFVCV